MRYSPFDLLLVLLASIQFMSLILWVKLFNDLSLMTNLGVLAVEVALFYFNPIVITHNFLHTPFFKARLVNRSFSIINSMNLGLPQILYKHHHLNHHRHNNSLADPSSTYLYGRNKQQEHWIPYCAFSLLRDGTKVAWKQTIQKNEGTWLAMEIIAVIVFLDLPTGDELEVFLPCLSPIVLLWVVSRAFGELLRTLQGEFSGRSLRKCR